MVALDLFAALMAADLPSRDAIVLAEVLLQTYGPNKPKRGTRTVHLDPAQIEHYTGLHRNNARKAIRELVAANILQQQPDGAYKFNKDYEEWIPGGEPIGERLGGGLLRFAASALTRHGLRNNQASDPIQRDCVSTNTPIQRDSSPNSFLNPVGLGSEGSCQSNGIGPDVDATGGKGGIGGAGAPAPGDLEIREKTEEAAAPSTPPGPPIPDHWEALCRLAHRLPGLGPDFASLLRRAWHYNGAVQGWWEKHPDPAIWDSALRDYAGQERTEQPTVRGFVTYARNAGQWARERRAKAEAPTPIPPKVTPNPNRRRRTYADPNREDQP